MKLLTKTTLYYLGFSVAIYLSIAVAFYYVTEYLIYEDVETRLQSEKRDFQTFIKNNGLWYRSCYFVQNKIEFKPSIYHDKKEVFIDTVLYDKYNYQLIPFRQLSFYEKLGDDYYKISIRKSLIESDKLVKYLTYTMLLLLILGLSVMYIVQRRISRRIWRPFYDTLSKIKSYKLSKDQELGLSNSSIYEFEELNTVLNKMARKMQKDYKNLKEFTQNASHEMQTPVALINARVEELIQSQNLTEKQIYLVQEINNSSNRISKLTQGLLLLSKIENRQFQEIKDIDFDVLIEKKIEELEELFLHRRLKVEYIKKGNFVFPINPDLADVLLNNLVGNAIKHNFFGGNIMIHLSEDGFEIINTGDELSIDPKTLFQRFRKGKTSLSTGLGLAIVKQICDVYSLTVEYYYMDKLHHMKISKGTAPTGLLEE